jgi:hypothetical protein
MGLLKNLRKLGIRGFFKKWKYGIMKIPPEQLLKQEIFGICGMLAATILAATVLILRGFWYISLVFLFSLIVQSANLISKWQQLKVMKGLPSEQLNMKELMGE